MQELLTMMHESIITQSALAILCTCVIGYMVIAGLEVPPELWAIEALILGYFFGAKQSLVSNRVAKRIEATHQGRV